MGSFSSPVDATAVPVGTEEELAGPPPEVVAPVRQQERVSSVDTLRGFALMGILIMNICDFAYGVCGTMPIRWGRSIQASSGPHWKVNTAAWFLRWVLAEGKMRGLFSLLFGAGVILLTQRAEARARGSAWQTSSAGATCGCAFLECCTRI